MKNKQKLNNKKPTKEENRIANIWFKLAEASGVPIINMNQMQQIKKEIEK